VYHPRFSAGTVSQEQVKSLQEENSELRARLEGRDPADGIAAADTSTDEKSHETAPEQQGARNRGDASASGGGEWGCVFVSAQYAKQLHGIDAAADDGAVVVAGWDGTCAMLTTSSSAEYDPGGRPSPAACRPPCPPLPQRAQTQAPADLVAFPAGWRYSAGVEAGLYTVKFGGRSKDVRNPKPETLNPEPHTLNSKP